MSLLTEISKKKKQFAVLIDPDKGDQAHFKQLAQLAEKAKVDYLLIGGSLLATNHLALCIQTLKAYSNIPVILFPGDAMQISPLADGILFLSLISGRNPELLIGKHVVSAPLIKQSNLEVLPTGYMLIDSGKPTSASYMSNSLPIPADKSDIAVCTAMAGELLGLRLIFMDAGSGAQQHVPLAMIQQVKENTSLPLWIGGGIRTPEIAQAICKAGADIVVAGTIFEEQMGLIEDMAYAIHGV